MGQTQELLLQGAGQQQQLHGVFIISLLHEGLEGSFHRGLSVTGQTSLLLHTDRHTEHELLQTEAPQVVSHVEEEVSFYEPSVKSPALSAFITDEEYFL